MSRGLGTNIFSLRYKHSVSIELKNGARHLKEHETKFDRYWFNPKGMAHLVWTGRTGVLQSILSSLTLKVYRAFAFKPITIKFGKFTYFLMLFQMACAAFTSIDTEYSYQEKICSYSVPYSFRKWPIVFSVLGETKSSLLNSTYKLGLIYRIMGDVRIAF